VTFGHPAIKLHTAPTDRQQQRSGSCR
jgi:hypothetical protein